MTLDALAPLLASHGIRLAALIPLSACRLTRTYLLDRAGLPTDRGSVLMLALPYRAGDEVGANLSAYAIPRDYHAVASTLFTRLIPDLEAAYPGTKFAGFADHSPIDERHAAACAGLGVIGDNGLLITRRYGSYVFLAELICDRETDAIPGEVGECNHCGACRAACPAGGETARCLSALTQKKGALSPDEAEAIVRGGMAWGCDICQTVCPMNRDAEISPYADLCVDRIPHLTAAQLEAMDDAAFADRAYAWRRRETILRNLRLLEAAHV